MFKHTIIVALISDLKLPISKEAIICHLSYFFYKISGQNTSFGFKYPAIHSMWYAYQQSPWIIKDFLLVEGEHHIWMSRNVIKYTMILSKTNRLNERHSTLKYIEIYALIDSHMYDRFVKWNIKGCMFRIQ